MSFIIQIRSHNMSLNVILPIKISHHQSSPNALPYLKNTGENSSLRSFTEVTDNNGATVSKRYNTSLSSAVIYPKKVAVAFENNMVSGC